MDDVPFKRGTPYLDLFASKVLAREIAAARREAATAPLYEMPEAEIEKYLNRRTT